MTEKRCCSSIVEIEEKTIFLVSFIHWAQVKFHSEHFSVTQTQIRIDTHLCLTWEQKNFQREKLSLAIMPVRAKQLNTRL